MSPFGPIQNVLPARHTGLKIKDAAYKVVAQKRYVILGYGEMTEHDRSTLDHIGAMFDIAHMAHMRQKSLDKMFLTFVKTAKETFRLDRITGKERPRPRRKNKFIVAFRFDGTHDRLTR